MGKEIHYQHRTSFLGRNGMFNQDGLIVSELGNEIIFAPITSKNQIGRARLSVPNSAIPELIQTLQTMLKP